MDKIFDNWEQAKKKLKEEHPQLTDHDLHYEPGSEADTLLRIAEKLKKTKKEIRDWLSILG